ncbi:MAG: amino acid deaminase [Actinobacteria bacterium]|nr:amino acid deaminase [Actinomycetota bacterium]
MKPARVDWRHKGFPIDRAVGARRIAARGWNALAGDLQLPVMVLRESAMEHNLSVVHGWCRDQGHSIAPHGKTTMSPEIVARQLEHGSWALTAATVHQARTLRRFGATRILIASQVVDAASLRWIAAQLRRGRTEIFSLVDSPSAVAVMDDALAPLGRRGRRMPVLLELGIDGGRTGCRDDGQIDATVDAIGSSPNLQLAGVEAFEGVVPGTDAAATAAVDRLLERVVATARRLDAAGAFFGAAEIVLSAGGSAFPDRAATAFSVRWPSSRPVRAVLRSGCYVVHDHGMYEASTPFGRRLETQALRPALEVVGAVLSRPEPGLAIVNFGKRDVPHDAGLPVVIGGARRGSARVEPLTGATVERLNDQHAWVRFDAAAPLSVGDAVVAGISHPCTAFDKWRAIPVVDDDYRVASVVTTYF